MPRYWTTPRRSLVSLATRLSLHLGVVVLLGVVLLFGAGMFAATQVQQDLLPDISIPAVIVITPDPGASPEIVDTQVTVPMVNALEGVSGVDTVQSSSSQGASLAIVLFKDGTDLKSAQQDVNTAITRVRSFLPAQVPAPAAPGSPPSTPTRITIGQVAAVQLVSVPADTITRTDGKPTIGLQVNKGPNSNTVTVANEVKAALPAIKSSIGHGVRVESIADQATPITQAIGDILREGLLGAVFAIFVIFAFLRSGRATIVAAVSIPLSLLVALIVLWQQGITLNILTLGGMMVAIGRVVDDSIVVLENISRDVSEGERPLVAAYTGAREIITAVSSSTLTTVAVFLPIAFLTGIAGSFFRPFALTVVVALLASLVVAVTVVPLLASRLLPAVRAEGVERRLKYSWTQRVYVPVIQWATGHRLLTLGAAAAFFIASMALIPLLRINLLDQS